MRPRGTVSSPSQLIPLTLTLPSYSFSPYEDSPQYIGYDATISAPHMHAHCLELMVDKVLENAHPKLLDVGCGSGYLTACFARLNERATVVGIDYVEKLTALAVDNLRKADGDLLDSGRVIIDTRNGWEGVMEQAPFDVIHVGAAADGYPMALMEQLKVGGKMVVPVGKQGEGQALVLVTRLDEGNTTTSFKCDELMGVTYVPLVNGPYKPKY